jgi:hypothetical protein
LSFDIPLPDRSLKLDRIGESGPRVLELARGIACGRHLVGIQNELARRHSGQLALHRVEDRAEFDAAGQAAHDAERQRSLKDGDCHVGFCYLALASGLVGLRPHIEPILLVNAVGPVEAALADLGAHHPKISEEIVACLPE